ncbi:hypothetical protein [Clostridium tagluense]|uniref:Uncharacterized protein n=1 Tax=Clostridium tagluense TaxID=360422 RepID=A0A401UU91_9CLOT|nr:hypothetical protein [Clostridium tagluense]GCD13107.1 hypothetical protein Ctaglu_47300 [Clostridium tagluense]
MSKKKSRKIKKKNPTNIFINLKLNENNNKNTVEWEWIYIFDLIDNLPYLEIICSTLKSFLKFKDSLLVNYKKLVKKESNIDQFFIDNGLGIKLDINTLEEKFNLMVTGNKVIENKEFTTKDIHEFKKKLEITRGIYLRIRCCDKILPKEEVFLIYVLNLTIDGNHVRTIEWLEGKKTFLSLPDSEWYESGSIFPGGLGLGTIYLDEDALNESAVTSIDYCNSDMYETFRDFLKENLLVDSENYATNFNVIIEDVCEGKLLVKANLTGQTNENQGYEAKVPIETTDNYTKFRRCFDRDGFAYFIMTNNSVVNLEEFCFKIKNITFMGNKNAEEFQNWVDPIELDLGGQDAKKRILVSSSNLEVGIYKYFYISEINPKNLRKIVNELISYNIGHEIQIPVAEAIFHMEQDTIGVISKLVPPPVYKLEDIREVDIEDFSLLIDMVAFDIFICNKDRHSDNICFFLSNNKYNPMFIDHTRALGGVEESDIMRLREESIQLCLHFVGLGLIANQVTNLNIFSNIVKRIKILNIENVVSKAIPSQLKNLLISNNVYKDNFDEYIIELLKWRQDNLEVILKKSLTL